jgi:PUA domain protein
MYIFTMTVLICILDPDILPHVQVDRGAIKFVMQGANIMCPGVTSPGGQLPPDLAADTIVAVMAEGKQLALAVGLMKMSSQEMYVYIEIVLEILSQYCSRLFQEPATVLR